METQTVTCRTVWLTCDNERTSLTSEEFLQDEWFVSGALSSKMSDPDESKASIRTELLRVWQAGIMGAVKSQTELLTKMGQVTLLAAQSLSSFSETLIERLGWCEEHFVPEDDIERTCIIISQVPYLLTAPFLEELIDRLKFLFEVAIEEDEQIELAPESLLGFLSFLQDQPQLKCPDITLTPKGHILAEWRQSSSQDFTAEFLQDGDARFVLFAPRRDSQSRPLRLSGLTSTSTLFETVEPHGITEWVFG